MKIFFVLVLTFSTVIAFDFKHIEVEYSASYGLLGEVGKATAVLEIEEDRYKIHVEAQSTGWAKWVTSGRKERYESRGLIKDGLLLPTLFIKDRIWGEKTERKRYAFHHDKEKIHTLLTKVDGIKTKETRHLLSFYAKNDILSLFFNLPQLIGKEIQTVKKEFVAVGASHSTGIVTIETPQGKMQKEISNLLDREMPLLILTLHQKIFSSRDGAFYLHINSDAICDRLLLKDVLMYGDLLIKAKRIKIE